MKYYIRMLVALMFSVGFSAPVIAGGYSVGGAVYGERGVVSGSITKYDASQGYHGVPTQSYNTYQHNPYQYNSRNYGCGYGRGYCSKGVVGRPVGINNMRSTSQPTTTITGSIAITK